MEINLWPLAVIHYTDKLPADYGGKANCFYVRIRTKYKNDLGIHAHELAHVSVFWRTCGLSIFLHFIKSFRLWNEGRAYLIQTKYPDRKGGFLTLESAAQSMGSPRYGFDMTYDELLTYLTKE